MEIQNEMHFLEMLNQKSEREGFITEFVYIGANDGYTDSYLYPFIKHNGWCGFFFEPQKEPFEKLKENYKEQKGLKFFNMAVLGGVNYGYFFIPDENEKNNLPLKANLYASFKRDVIKKHIPEKSISKTNVACCNINNVFDYENPNNDIDITDVLVIDTEGLEYELLTNLRIEKFNISSILFEISHITGHELDNLIVIYRANGYSYHEFGINGLFIKKII